MHRTLAISAVVVAVLAVCAPPWIALAYHAASYPVTKSGEAANVVVDGAFAYASLAECGFEIVDTDSGKILGVVAPPPNSESVDDLAIADGLLFVLDARPPGHLSVFSLADPSRPSLVSPPVGVDVGPFSGVSAARGNVIVSGGTSLLSMRSYDGRGVLGPVLATGDYGRGQPDVLLAPDGTRAFVSTHTWGPYFRLTTVRVGNSLAEEGRVSLDTYGFTNGGAKPASFPVEAAVEGDVALVADRSGLTVISVADLAKPEILARLDVGVEAVNVDARDGVAAIIGSSPEPRLVLVDITNPSSPRIVRTILLPNGSQPTGVAIGRTRVAVASHRNGVLLFPR